MSAVEFYYHNYSNIQPLLSIRTTGCIGFNKAAIEKFNLEKGMFFLLGYDRVEKKIVLKQVEPNALGARKLHLHLQKKKPIKEPWRTYSNAINAKGFLKYFNINYDVCQTYPAIQNTDKSIEAILKKGTKCVRKFSFR